MHVREKAVAAPDIYTRLESSFQLSVVKPKPKQLLTSYTTQLISDCKTNCNLENSEYEAIVAFVYDFSSSYYYAGALSYHCVFFFKSVPQYITLQ